MPRKRYTNEFRQECVNLLLSSGRGLKRVAAELGISSNALREWRDRALSHGRAAQAGRRDIGRAADGLLENRAIREAGVHGSPSRAG